MDVFDWLYLLLTVVKCHSIRKTKEVGEYFNEFRKNNRGSLKNRLPLLFVGLCPKKDDQ